MIFETTLKVLKLDPGQGEIATPVGLYAAAQKPVAAIITSAVCRRWCASQS